MTNFGYLAGSIPFPAAHQGRCEYLSLNELRDREFSVREEDLQRFPDHDAKVAIYQTEEDMDSVYINTPAWENAPWEFYFAGKYFVSLHWKFSDDRAGFLLAYLADYLRYAPVVEIWDIWAGDVYPMPPPEVLTYSFADLTIDLMQELTLLRGRGRGVCCIRIFSDGTCPEPVSRVVSPEDPVLPLDLPLHYTSRNDDPFPAHHFYSLSSRPHPRRFDYYILHEDIQPDRPCSSGMYEFLAGSVPFTGVTNPHVTRLSLHEYLNLCPETRDGFSLCTAESDAPIVAGCSREELLGELSVSPDVPGSFEKKFTAFPHTAVVFLNYTVPRAAALCRYIRLYLTKAEMVELWSVHRGSPDAPPKVTECCCSELTPGLLAGAAGYSHPGVRCLIVRKDASS